MKKRAAWLVASFAVAVAGYVALPGAADATPTCRSTPASVSSHTLTTCPLCPDCNCLGSSADKRQGPRRPLRLAPPPGHAVAASRR